MNKNEEHAGDLRRRLLNYFHPSLVSDEVFLCYHGRRKAVLSNPSLPRDQTKCRPRFQ
jgi:hypothetical protein